MAFQNRTSKIYVLGTGDPLRITVRSQQKRAITLIDDLIKLAAIDKNTKLKDEKFVVIGGGVAGITAACRAAEQGLNVTLYEKGTDVLHFFGGAEHRMLHPGITDWPMDGWSDEKTTDLQILNWECDFADKVASDLRKKFEGFRVRYKDNLECRCNVKLKLTDIQRGILIVDPVIIREEQVPYDHLILALGHGQEQVAFNGMTYWQQDHLDKEFEGTTHVFGCGDGGILDCLRMRIVGFNEKMLSEFLRDRWDEGERNKTAKDIMVPFDGQIRSDVVNHEDVAERIQHCSGLAEDLKKWISKNSRNDSGRVRLIGRNKWPHGNKAAPLHRLLITCLEQIENKKRPNDKKFEYVQAELEKASIEDSKNDPHTIRYKLANGTRSVISIDPSNRVILRLGPEKSPLEEFSSDLFEIWKKSGARHSWTDPFGPSPPSAPVVPPAQTAPPQPVGERPRIRSIQRYHLPRRQLPSGLIAIVLLLGVAGLGWMYMRGGQVTTVLRKPGSVACLVPLYTAKSNYWETALATAKKHQNTDFWIVANAGGVMNGQMEDFQPYLNAQKDAPNVRILGYVSAAQVNLTEEVNLWIAAGARGIFVDNTGELSLDDARKLYQKIRNAGAQRIISCPGSRIDRKHYKLPTADMFCLGNTDAPDYEEIQKLVKQQREVRIPKDIGFGIIHHTVGDTELEQVCKKAIASGCGFVALSDAGSLKESWIDGESHIQRLPHWWEKFVDILETHNVAIKSSVSAGTP